MASLYAVLEILEDDGSGIRPYSMSDSSCASVLLASHRHIGTNGSRCGTIPSLMSGNTA